MTDFWLAAGLLLLVALAFLLLPLVRGRRAQTEEDRTALNVALYQERLAELDAQHAAGSLSAEALQAGRDEAARELLADTEGAERVSVSRLGRAVPMAVALLVPVVGYGLYLHWGASDRVELSRELAVAPRSLAEMTARLERTVQAQPESAQGWYFLGRTYMAQERASDAARAFAQAIQVGGRQPELLGQLAQALYFAGNKQWNEQIQKLTDEALAADPGEVTSLGLLGIAAFESARYQDAIGFWQRLIDVLPPQDPSREAIAGGIARARKELGDAAPAVAEQGAALHLQVALGAAARAHVQPGDSVFVFARVPGGPPMPLAAKRLSVADLPAEVTLSDADAMLPQMKLSAFEQVEVVARVSREGNASAGEWVGRTPLLSTKLAEPQALSIDQPDQVQQPQQN